MHYMHMKIRITSVSVYVSIYEVLLVIIPSEDYIYFIHIWQNLVSKLLKMRSLMKINLIKQEKNQHKGKFFLFSSLDKL